MSHTMAFDYSTAPGLTTRGLWLSSSAGVLFYGKPTAAATKGLKHSSRKAIIPGVGFVWTRVVTPPISSSGGVRATTAVNVLCTSKHAPGLLLMGRGDGLWVSKVGDVLNTRAANADAGADADADSDGDGDGAWAHIGAALIFGPSAIQMMPQPLRTVADAAAVNSVSVLVGAGTTKYGSLAGRNQFDSFSPRICSRTLMGVPRSPAPRAIRVFSWGGSMLPSIHADVRSPDAVIAF